MSKFLRHMEEVKEFIMLELQDSRPLTDAEKTILSHITNLDFKINDVYRNDSCLVITGQDEFEAFMMSTKGCKLLFKIESEQLGLNVYIVNFVDCKFVWNALGGETYVKPSVTKEQQE